MPDLAGIAASNHQPTGSIDPDDRFQPASSADWMSNCDANPGI
jgi:hypothetical protein